ncbi:MAG TPA: alpha/beta fold hydrolase [Polyangiales bacterium]|nr:alpha/beta fold hydrolase [Polyangiales bacterium]
MSFVNIPGGRLAYAWHGDHAGTPLLLIRPLGGTMALWDPFRLALAERVRVLSFDLRGTGASSAHAPFGTRAIARDALALLRALGVPRAHVFGISLGGMAATWLALDAPSSIARLCIACAPPLGLELTHAGLRRELAMAACFLRPRGEVEPALVTRVLSHRFRREHPDRVRRIAHTVAANPSTRASLFGHALAGLLHRPRHLSQLRVPTLVLSGQHDGLLGSAPPRELAAKIPGAEWCEIPDSGHDLTLEQPDETARVVLAYLERNLA